MTHPHPAYELTSVSAHTTPAISISGLGGSPPPYPSDSQPASPIHHPRGKAVSRAPTIASLLADLSLRVATRAWRVLPVFASLTLTRLPLFLPARRPRPTRADTAGDRFSRWSRWSTTCGKHRSPGLMGLMGPASALDTRPGFEFPNILGQNV